MGAGDDLIAGLDLFETVVGGAGIDTISYINHPRAMLINLFSQVSADGISHDIFSSVENAVCSAFDDTIHGDDSPLGNVLDGGPGGSDQIFGRGGPDTVSYASAVRAVLINLAGQVTADGDAIVSGTGASVLEGRGGNDTFLFRRGEANGDTVVDFAGNGAFHGDMLQFVGYGP